jgi:phosphoenolpyruvate carboxylase
MADETTVRAGGAATTGAPRPRRADLRRRVLQRDVRRAARLGPTARRAARRGADPARGAHLLDLVERVRRLARQPDDGAELAALLSGVDEPTAIVLARAFTAYFQLANITEQLHRSQELAARPAGTLSQTVDRIAAAIADGAMDAAQAQAIVDRLELRPVFTAHPTEASRRSVLDLLRRVAELVAEDEDPRQRPDGAERVQRRLAEVVDLLWQTDELRVDRPQPTDEARTAAYYLESLAGTSSRAARGARPAAGAVGVRLGRDARPLRFGSWAGGDRDGNPNVTPAVTLEVLTLQHEFGLRALIAAVDDLILELSASTRVVGVSPPCSTRSKPTARRCPRCTTGTSGSTRRSRTG